MKGKGPSQIFATDDNFGLVAPLKAVIEGYLLILSPSVGEDLLCIG
jgi:hypothetical protein